MKGFYHIWNLKFSTKPKVITEILVSFVAETGIEIQETIYMKIMLGTDF